MEQNQNIGKWNAVITSDGASPDKRPSIEVNGTFPTKGEQPLFSLQKAEPQGINPSELLLDLMFGELADPDGEGEATVDYREDLETVDDYKTVLVVDRDSRTIAHLDVTITQS